MAKNRNRVLTHWTGGHQPGHCHASSLFYWFCQNHLQCGFVCLKAAEIYITVALWLLLIYYWSKGGDGWESNCRPSVILSMSHRLSYKLQGHTKICEHLAYVPLAVWNSLYIVKCHVVFMALVSVVFFCAVGWCSFVVVEFCARFSGDKLLASCWCGNLKSRFVLLCSKSKSLYGCPPSCQFGPKACIVQSQESILWVYCYCCWIFY